MLRDSFVSVLVGVLEAKLGRIQLLEGLKGENGRLAHQIMEPQLLALVCIISILNII